jgi:preprotein translocase subunit SecY
VFKPKEISKNLAANSGTIPGIRPGINTEKYISKVSNRLCLASGVFLGLISSLPILTSVFSTLQLSFGGTSILIVVGVALDTMKQIDNKVTLDNNYGFLNSFHAG